MNKRCCGCGALLQSSNPEEVGYVKEDKELCERCFKIVHYGSYKPITKDKKELDFLLDEINKSDELVVLVIDLFNFNPNLDIFNKLNNDVLLVLTKRDVLPKSIYDERLLNYIDNANLNIVDRIIISSNKNYQFDLLLEKINSHKKSHDVYVLGLTNAGKSTMINKLIKNYSETTLPLTTSLLPNTTLDKLHIKISDNLTLIDTPGIIDSGNISYYLDLKRLKKVIPHKEIKPITYQVKKPSFFMVDNLVYLEVKNNNVTFYFSRDLEIKRYYKKISTCLEKYEFDVSSNEDIVISGMGFVRFTKKEHIVIYTIKDVLVYKRKSLI